MSIKNFISVTNHPESYYTASTLDSMIDKAIALGNEYFAVTDTGGLPSILKAYTKCKKKNIKIIPGIEIYFKDKDCPIIKNTESDKINYFKLIIHAKDQAAYQKLAQMVSNYENSVIINESKYKLFNWADLKEISQFNVSVCTSDVQCMVSKHLFVGRADLGVKYYLKLKEIFGEDRFYPALIPTVYDQHWTNMVNVKLGIIDKEIQIPANTPIETDAYSRSTAIDLTRKYSKHTKLEYVYINKIRNKVLPAFQSINGVATTVKTFQPIPSSYKDLQLYANKLILSLARKFGDLNRVLINSNSYYSDKEDKIVQDMKLGEDNRISQLLYMRSNVEVFDYLSTNLGLDVEIIERLIGHTHKWAENFKDFELKYEYHLPKVDGDLTPEQKMVEIIKQKGRMDWKNPLYVKQFKEEYELLVNNGVINLVPYFLPIIDMQNYYSKIGKLTGSSRGSSGGFLLSYLLGVTHIDPLKYGLSSGRFLTLDRIQQGNLPDIDVDFEDRLDLVGADGNSGFLAEKYGDKFAQVSTRTLLRLKSSILDVNRFMNGGEVEPAIAELSKSLPTAPQGITDNDFVFGYEDADGNRMPGILEINDNLQKYAVERPKEWEIVKRTLSLSRQTSRHASAFVISDEPIENTVPIFEVGGVKRVTQPEAKQCEFAGLIKYDLLVVSALKDIRYCIDLVNKKNKQVNKGDELIGWWHDESDSGLCCNCDPDLNIDDPTPGIDLTYYSEKDVIEEYEKFERSPICDNCKKTYYEIVEQKHKLETGYFIHNGTKTYIWDLPEDQEVYMDLHEGKTETVFQLNTTAVLPFVKEIKPKSIAECAVITSLVRPGPLDFKDPKTGRNMAQEYIERRVGNSKGEIEILNQMIPETYGIIVFQEQVSRICRELAGMSIIDSENVRIAMGKKQVKLLNSLKQPFIDGAMKKIDQETAEKIWSMMATFARYSFNLSHATGYSVISYACAFLKHHYPLEWWASVLSNADDKEINEHLIKYVRDLILPPDINLSDDTVVIDYNENKLRYKLSMISGLGDKLAGTILAGRPYKDIKDFVVKKGCTPAMTKKLIHVGVLDSLFPPKANNLDKMKAYEQAVNEHIYNEKLAGYNKQMEDFKALNKRIEYQKVQKQKERHIAKGVKESVIDDSYVALTAHQDFLMKKSVLPSMSLDLDELLTKYSHTPVLNTTGYRLIQNNYGRENRLIKGFALKAIDEQILTQDAYFCVPGYVVDVKEFNYANQTKKALKVFIDSSGYVSEKVLWADYNTGELKYPPALKKGCIAYFFYRKKIGRKDAYIYDVIIEHESIIAKESKKEGKNK